VSLSILASTVPSLTHFRHIHIHPHPRTLHPQSFRRRIHRVSESSFDRTAPHRPGLPTIGIIDVSNQPDRYRSRTFGASS
jgi:hypothetical protein